MPIYVSMCRKKTMYLCQSMNLCVEKKHIFKAVCHKKNKAITWHLYLLPHQKIA